MPPPNRGYRWRRRFQEEVSIRWSSQDGPWVQSGVADEKSQPHFCSDGRGFGRCSVAQVPLRLVADIGGSLPAQRPTLKGVRQQAVCPSPAGNLSSCSPTIRNICFGSIRTTHSIWPFHRSSLFLAPSHAVVRHRPNDIGHGPPPRRPRLDARRPHAPRQLATPVARHHLRLAADGQDRVRCTRPCAGEQLPPRDRVRGPLAEAAAARPGRRPRPPQRARPHGMGGFLDGHAGGGQRRRDNGRGHAAQRHPTHDDAGGV